MLSVITQNPLQIGAFTMVLLYILTYVAPPRFERPIKAVALISILAGLFVHGLGT